MAEEGRNLSLVILGIVAIIAVVGLVLLLSGGRVTKTGQILNVPALAGKPMCDSPCTPVLMGPTEADALFQKADFEKAFGKKCYKTGYEDPRYPGVMVEGDDNLYCCCPTVGDKSILVGDSSLVKGPPFNDFAGIPNERDKGVPVGPYVIEK
ncbi:MAG: hypothetical protein QXT19_02215 [Candidatus Woesearchaeota archaeon]